MDKKVWILWAEGRVHGEYDAIRTPIGYLPLHDDLRGMFRQVFDKEYTQEEYDQQFSVRVDRYLEKIARMEEIYRGEPDTPAEFWEVLETQKGDLLILKEQTGKTVLEPAFFL
ncbi:hypothetical protein ES703_116923 [subsurface metagenome]